MYNLSENSTFKVTTPADTYIYDLIQLSNGSVAAISSDDCLRILNPVDLSRGEVSLVKGVGKGVTCASSINAEGGEVVVTAGGDGKVGIWDLRAGGGNGRVGELRSGELLEVSFAYTVREFYVFMRNFQAEFVRQSQFLVSVLEDYIVMVLLRLITNSQQLIMLLYCLWRARLHTVSQLVQN